MTEIRLHNTLTRRKEVFAPLDPNNVRMYLCGPTVYDRAHIGNARPVIVFDVLFRLLRHVYGAKAVTYVRNFTDVDDKINARAAQRKSEGDERSLIEIARAITDETIGWYLDDMAALGALQPTHMPRATEYIPQMVAMIERLIEKGHAYPDQGHVLFKVDSYQDEYGQLSGRSVDDMIAGARVEIAPYKLNPMDFVLWKPSGPNEPAWPGPKHNGEEVSRGRPGWHIECSAMADKLLWEDMKDSLSPEALKHSHVFDIHGGGNDLLFPHHENEIAQSCCANGTEKLAQFWLHNEMLQVEGKKMSKSLGNFFTVRDLLDQGVPGEVIRFVFLKTHYSNPMDWTAKAAKEAEEQLFDYILLIADLADISLAKSMKPDEQVIAALSSDLNSHEAMRLLKVLWHDKNANVLAATLVFLGFYSWAQLEQRVNEILGIDLSRFAAALINARAAAIAKASLPGADKKECFRDIDALKSALTAAGVEVRMSKDGVDLLPTTNFDPSKLEGLL